MSIPSRSEPSVEDDAFHLPIPGLFVDLDVGCGSVALTGEFLGAAPEIRSKVLQHWLRALSTHRDASLVEMFREFSGPLRTLTIVKQLERFKQHCGRQGVNCPDDLPVLLQRF